MRSRIGRLLDDLAVAPSTGSKVAHLDGLRAIAVFLVVLVHVWYYSGAPQLRIPAALLPGRPALWPFFNSAYVGVDLFFILSGFLLSRPWIVAHNVGQPRPGIGRYAWLRFFRIVPAYYACLFLMLLFMTPAYIPTSVVYSIVGAQMLAAHLTFTHFLFPFSAGSYLVNGSVWTLTIEMIFYVLLPIVVRLFYGRRWVLSLLGAAGVSLLWAYLTRHSLGPLVDYIARDNSAFGWTPDVSRSFLSRQFPAHLTDFAIGMTIQNWLCIGEPRHRLDTAIRTLIGSRALMTAVFIFGTGFLLYSMYEISAGSGTLFPVYLKGISMAVAFGCILLGLDRGADIIRRFFSLALLRFFGIIGYSVFLWHMPVIQIVIKYPAIESLAPSTRMLAVLLLAGTLATLLSFGFYLAVERPFMVWSRNRIAARRRDAEAPAQVLAAP